jgi:hypothetical protein
MPETTGLFPLTGCRPSIRCRRQSSTASCSGEASGHVVEFRSPAHR